MKVAFVGAFDPEYPRTRVLREGLEEVGVEVLSLAAPARARPGVRQLAIVLAWAGRSAGVDAFLVPSFGHRDVALMALLARVSGAPLLFDPLVSRWDTQVRDLGRVRAGSISAARAWLSDRLALSLPDVVLCDTWEHGDLYSTAFGVPRRRIARVPVGADHAAFAMGKRRADRALGSAGPLEVVFVGGFLPLHGTPVIVEAASLLERKHGPGFARFHLVGDGMHAHRVDRDVAALGLRSVRRTPRVSYAQALAALDAADVALGIFGTSGKAGRVVPHKVYQSLALGVATVTRRSAAIAEFFRSGRNGRNGRNGCDGEHLLTVPAGDAAALALALEELGRDPLRRERIGAAGRAAVLAQASPRRVGEALLEAIERSRAMTAPRVKR